MGNQYSLPPHTKEDLKQIPKNDLLKLKFDMTIKQKLAESMIGSNSSSSSSVVNLIFDTDIGSDIDDALALVSVLNLPREAVNVLGVTTVYGYVEVRSQVASRIVQAYAEDEFASSGRVVDIPVLTGSHYSIDDPIVLDPCWHANTEGIGLFKDEEIEKMKQYQNCYLDRNELMKQHSKKAAEFIVQKAKELNGNLVIVSLGGLTNVAMAYQMDNNLTKLVKRVVFMGGGVVPVGGTIPDNFERGVEYHCHSNHNIRQDQFAANVVFSAGFDVYCVGHTVTHSVWFEGKTVDFLRTLSFHKGQNPYENDNIIESYDPQYPKMAHILGTLLDVWLKHRSVVFSKTIKGTCPHDALTTYEAIFNQQFIKYVRGHFIVNETDGKVCFIYDPDYGKVNVAIGFQNDQMPAQMLSLLSESLLKAIPKDDLHLYGLHL
ncbi:predicted protein [Naegleria gruberi]|uniref:Predicted protein n=1 Tax=Naegleria gruberi TaxID=5762 RepID=D2VFZ4_NAEGR|nr:uncharacterized protein NAEGRDRAFT_67798 [Naegleria gruberi]EFC44168.1 predicted protein [Naegleria gruberi]|eukprot:XP_002676912.1 predicted protein [Naegleria gruberi strain NEG-M]